MLEWDAKDKEKKHTKKQNTQPRNKKAGFSNRRNSCVFAVRSYKNHSNGTSWIGQHLKSQIRAPGQSLSSQFISFSCILDIADDGLSTWVPATHMGQSDWVLGSWLWSHLTWIVASESAAKVFFSRTPCIPPFSLSPPPSFSLCLSDIFCQSVSHTK